MNIAIVVESLHTGGGVERRTSELVKGLLSAGHQVHVYANRWDSKAAPGARFHFIPILRLGRAMSPLSFAWFSSLLVRKKHDLIHTQSRVFRYDVATLGVGCHRAYLDAMGIDPDKAPDRRFHKAVLKIESSMLKPGAYRRIIVNSMKCRNELMRYYGVPEDSLRVIHNGVDHEAFSPEVRARLRPGARKELGLSPDEIAVLFVGSGFERKGLDTLIGAAGLVPAKRLKLIVAGRGDRERYEKQASGNEITWVGQTGDIAQFYAVADIFALPTRYDPFANSTMEALACGLPTITTTANGVSEILTDGVDAVIAAPNDAGALSEKLSALADDSNLRERLGPSGHKAVEPYTWQRTTKETMAVYEEILNG